MFGKRKQRWIYLAMITLCLGLLFSRSQVFALDEFSIDTFAQKIATELDNVKSTKMFVDSYCDMVFTKVAPFTKGNFVYNAKYSAFVYLLCSNARSDFAEKSSLPEAYFSHKTFADLGFKTYQISDVNDDEPNNLCAPMTNDCNLAKHIPNLFNDIMTDYVNMKQANIYGMNTNFKEENEIKDQINIFSSEYFDGLKLCSTEGRTYPKTCKMMQGYIKNARNLLSDVYIFSGITILDANASFDSSVCAGLNEKNNLFLCGLYGDPTTSMISFVNLTYNELFYYRLFVGYYFLLLQKYPNILSNSAQNNDIHKLMKKFSSQYTWSKTAMSLTFRMMRDTYMAFPFHVGFSMYQEDLDNFGKLLSRVAPPIYTLYDKLRNVQKPQ